MDSLLVPITLEIGLLVEVCIEITIFGICALGLIIWLLFVRFYRKQPIHWSYWILVTFSLTKSLWGLVRLFTWVKKWKQSSPLEHLIGHLFWSLPMAMLLSIFTATIFFWITQTLKNFASPFSWVELELRKKISIASIMLNCITYSTAIITSVVVCLVNSQWPLIVAITNVIFASAILFIIAFLIFSASILSRMRNSCMPGTSSINQYSEQKHQLTAITVISSVWMVIYSGLLFYDAFFLIITGDFHDSTPFGDPLVLLFAYRVCEVMPILSLAYMLKNFVGSRRDSANRRLSLDNRNHRSESSKLLPK